MAQARVARVTLDPERVDEFIRSWENEVLSIARAAPGFVRAYGLHDPKTREALSVMLVERPETLNAAWSRMQQAAGALTGYAAGPASFGTYDVRIEA